MDLFFVLLVLLVVTRALGEIAERVGQPALVGELIAGIVLGAAAAHWSDLVPGLSALREDAVFGAITDLGMFFIMLFAGIEMQPHKLVEHSRGAVLVAVGGMVLPLGLGAGLGWAYLPASELKAAQSLFLGTALAITAVPATVRILMDLGKLESRSGQLIVSAAVFDDILSLLVLAWLTAFIAGNAAPGPAELTVMAVKVGAFFAVTIAVGYFLFPLAGQAMRRAKVQELDLSAMLIAALAFSVLAEALGLHFILGAFVAGVFFGRKTVDDETYEDVRGKVSGMTFGFLAPIFFASVGLNLESTPITEIPGFFALLLAAAFLGKLLGAGAGALMAGLGPREAGAVGVGMSARGAVELVVADIALDAGLFHLPGVDSPVLANLFSAVVLMAVITTLATPVLLQRIYRRAEL